MITEQIRKHRTDFCETRPMLRPVTFFISAVAHDGRQQRQARGLRGFYDVKLPRQLTTIWLKFLGRLTALTNMQTSFMALITELFWVSSCQYTPFSLGLRSWNHLSDQWSWRHATIWSQSWSRPQWSLVNNIQVFYQAIDNCKTAFPSLPSSGRECNLIADVIWPVL